MFHSSRTSAARHARMPLALLVGLVILSVAGAPVLACYDTNSVENRAKNLIVFVVDGFGYGAQSLARLSLSTPDNPLRLESLPYVGVLNIFGRTALRGDENSALWGLIWGLGADPGEVPAQVAERASWFSVAKEAGQRALGVVSDGNLADSVWPLGAIVPPTQAGVVPPAKLPASVAPDFLFGWTPGGADWTAAPSGAKVKVTDTWDPKPSEKAGLWYLLPGTPSDPLSGEASPVIPQVVDQAITRLSANKEGFVLLVHAGELGKALEKRDLGLVTAQLALLDEAIGKALNFTDSAEGTAVLLVSTGDPVGLTIFDNFNPRYLDGLQQPVAKVAASVASASSVDAAQASLKSGLGLEIPTTDVDALRKMKAIDLEAALSARVAERVGVSFGSSGNAINPAPIMGYGPGSWVYGRLAKAPDIPALAVGQLWLDPSSLTRTAAVK